MGFVLFFTSPSHAGVLFPPSPDTNGHLYWDHSSGSVKTITVPTCTGANTLKWTGAAFSCTPLTIPSCTGSNVALQWNGSNFICQTISVAGSSTTTTTPTPTTTTPVTPSTPTYTYAWSTGTWGSCTLGAVYCNGTKARSVVCKRNDGTTVSDSYCSGSKPLTTTACVFSTPSTEPEKGAQYLERYPDLRAAYYSGIASWTDPLCSVGLVPSAYNLRVAMSCRGKWHYSNFGRSEKRCY
ncbi:MAG: thrombospondin type-1 domain-containing protein [Bdellovibrionales bacterium]